MLCVSGCNPQRGPFNPIGRALYGMEHWLSWLQQCAGLMPDEWMNVRLCVFKHTVLDGENVTEFLMHLKAENHLG